jgi:hypothetical protein
MNIGDKVLATFPSGWTVGGTVLQVMSGGKEIDVLFLDGCHQAFSVENVKSA